MSTVTDQAPVDRLCDRHALLKLTPAGQVELFAILDSARSQAKRPQTGENPEATYRAGMLAGFSLHRLVIERTAASRRGGVEQAVIEWLPDVLALSGTEYRLTVEQWARRAQAARDDQAEHQRARVRA